MVIATAASVLAGCVEGFRGSNVQIDLSPVTPVQASPGATPAAGQLPSNVHFRLYAIQHGDTADSLFEIQRFEVHPIVDVTSPCFIDVGERVPYPGLHVSQYGNMIAADTGIPDVRNPPAGATEEQKIDAATAVQRMANIAALGGAEGIKVVTSASAGGYPPVAADCTGPGIPPSTCTDAAANARRLELCQTAWAADPALWEGTDRVLTSPLAGTTFGMVVGMNPINLAPVGGAQFFVDEALSGIDAYAIYWQQDDLAGPGNLLLFGRPTVPAPTRGVTHVHMTSPTNPAVTAEIAIFADLGEDEVHF